MVEFYLLNKRYTQAIKIVEKLKENFEREAIFLYYEGMCYEGLREIDKARESYREALDINPNMEKAKEHLKRIINI